MQISRVIFTLTTCYSGNTLNILAKTMRTCISRSQINSTGILRKVVLGIHLWQIGKDQMWLAYDLQDKSKILHHNTILYRASELNLFTLEDLLRSINRPNLENWCFNEGWGWWGAEGLWGWERLREGFPMGRVRKQHQEIQESKRMMKITKLLLLVLEKLQQKEEAVSSKERGQEIFRREKKYSRNCKALTWILYLNPRANYITSSFSVF